MMKSCCQKIKISKKTVEITNRHTNTLTVRKKLSIKCNDDECYKISDDKQRLHKHKIMIKREINCNIVDGHNRNSILVLFILINYY